MDVLLDGHVVERWTSGGLSGGQDGTIEDWTGLNQLAKLDAGRHTLAISVDSTNLIPESDESDNKFSINVEWTENPNEQSEPRPAIALPDLVPTTPDGWQSQIIASAYPNATEAGPLSVDSPTYIRYGIGNSGRASTEQTVFAHLYLNDILVSKDSWRGLLSDGVTTRGEWDGLASVTRLFPGTHTLRLEIDPLDTIAESDESNNVVEVELDWTEGPIPSRPDTVTAAPELPNPPTLPNLQPGWRFGWDGPIIASNETGTFTDGPLIIGERPFIDIVVQNQSTVPITGVYTATLYFDDHRVATLQSKGSSPGAFLEWWDDFRDLTNEVEITPGPHVLKLVIDETNRIEELDETDNVYEKTFVWRAVPQPEPTLVTYSDWELVSISLDVPNLIESTAVVAEGDSALRNRIISVADLGYYLLTGRSIQDEPLDLHLVTRPEFESMLLEGCNGDYLVNPPQEYQRIYDVCQRSLVQLLGFTSVRNGRITVAVDADQSPAAVLDTVAHELGHMLQKLLNNEQSMHDRSDVVRGVLEAQAQQFQRAFWLTIEEFAGIDLASYPDIEPYRKFVAENLQFRLGDAFNDEHSLGYLLQWAAALDDPELASVRSKLVETGKLDAANSMLMYDRLVSLHPSEIPRWVEDRLTALRHHTSTIESIILDRLISGLSPDFEGHPALRLSGLMMP